MFEIENAGRERVKIVTKNTSVVFDVIEGEIEAGLEVGKIKGPGEFEIGEVAISGVEIKGGKTIYVAEIGGVRVGMIGDTEEGLDDVGVIDVLCTSSVRAVREIAPKVVVATGNAEKMSDELKVNVRTDKKLKIKNSESLMAAQEILVLG